LRDDLNESIFEGLIIPVLKEIGTDPIVNPFSLLTPTSCKNFDSAFIKILEKSDLEVSLVISWSYVNEGANLHLLEASPT
jgi:hypothetical protein